MYKPIPTCNPLNATDHWHNIVQPLVISMHGTCNLMYLILTKLGCVIQWCHFSTCLFRWTLKEALCNTGVIGSTASLWGCRTGHLILTLASNWVLHKNMRAQFTSSCLLTPHMICKPEFTLLCVCKTLLDCNVKPHPPPFMSVPCPIGANRVQYTYLCTSTSWQDHITPLSHVLKCSGQLRTHMERTSHL